MKIKRKVSLSISLSLIITLALSINVLAVMQYYPADYTNCYMPGYKWDNFANASHTPDSPEIRTSQSIDAANLFKKAYNTTATPYYTNMWGTYSYSQTGAHEGLDMVYGGTGQPIYSWGWGTVTVRDDSVGLLGVYSSYANQTVFYRHMNTINPQYTVGTYVYFKSQVGTQGSLGNSSGTHLHTGAEQGNRTSDSSGSDDDFTSVNIYALTALFGT